MEALKKKRAQAEIVAEEELAAEVSASRQRTEDALAALHAEADSRMERHRFEAEEEERQAADQLRMAKQVQEGTLAELTAEVSAARQRNEEQLMALRTDAAAQLELHKSAVEEQERQAAEAMRTAKQSHEYKLQELVVSAKQRAQVTNAALQQEAEEKQMLQLQHQKTELQQTLADLRNVSAAEIAKAQHAEAAELAAVQVLLHHSKVLSLPYLWSYFKAEKGGSTVLQKEVARAHAAELEQTERSHQNALEKAVFLLQVRR